MPFQYPTITAAIVAAAEGDVVLVSPGIYPPVSTDPDIFGFWPVGKNVVLLSSDGPRVTTISGFGSRGALDISSGQTDATFVEGFTICHGKGSTSFDGSRPDAGGMTLRGTNPRIRNCIITLSEGTGVTTIFNTGSGGAGGLFTRNSDATLKIAIFARISVVLDQPVQCFQE